MTIDTCAPKSGAVELVIRRPLTAFSMNRSDAVHPELGTDPEPSMRKAMSRRASQTTRVGPGVGVPVGEGVVGARVLARSILTWTSSSSMHPHPEVCE